MVQTLSRLCEFTQCAPAVQDRCTERFQWSIFVIQCCIAERCVHMHTVCYVYSLCTYLNSVAQRRTKNAGHSNILCCGKMLSEDYYTFAAESEVRGF